MKEHEENAVQQAQEERQKLESELHELSQYRDEVSGLRASRDRLQDELSKASVELKDEKERVRSAGRTGVVWSARREAPKEEGLLGKLKSPFKRD